MTFTAQTQCKQFSYPAICSALLVFGLWCFPLYFKYCEGKYQKLPLVKWGPFQDRPPTQVERDDMAKKHARAVGAGIPLGCVMGTFVLDTDNADAIEWVELRGMPPTWLVRTPHGLHYYFKYPPDIQVRNSAGEISAGVDIRGTHGMTVAAGSGWPGYFKYEWEPDHSPADLPLADAPSWLLNWLRQDAERHQISSAPVPPQPYRGRVRAWARKAYDAELDLLRSAEPGTRNDACCRTAFRLGQLCGGGELNSASVIAALHSVANGWPNAPHTVDSINRAFKAGEAVPRCAPARRPAASALTKFNLDAPLGSGLLTLYDKPLGGAA
jgi:hypothetical protein